MAARADVSGPIMLDAWPPGADAVAALCIVGVVGVAAVLDVRTGRIPNLLTYGAALLGLALAAWTGGLAGAFSGIAGLVVGLVPGMALFAAGVLGGGDAKLIAAVGALVGYPLIIDAVLLIFIVGGAMALSIIVWKGRTAEFLRGVAQLLWFLPVRGAPRAIPVGDLKMPFAVAIAVGTVWAIFGSLRPLSVLLGTGVG